MDLTHHRLSADIVVAGGGPAGLPAALAAARHGAKVVLIQDRHVLGGNSSSEVRMHIVGADRHGKVPHARESGIIEELRLEDAVWNPQRSSHMWDQLLYDTVVSEPNITLLLNTTVDGVVMEENPLSLWERDGVRAPSRRIRAVTAERPSQEERFTIEAQLFLDCTGDGRLGVEAGAEFRMGRESKHEFNEDLAWVEEADSKTLGSSIMFTARRYDRPMPFKAPAWARKINDCEELPHRPHAGTREAGFEYGYWWLEWGGQLNTIKDNDAIRHELTRIVLGVWDHIKNSGRHPESENWALDWVASIPGKRESRRFMGDYLLNQHDLQAGRIFEDEVAFGGWAIDEHPPEGVDNPGRPFIPVPVPLYSIPLRCLYSRNVENLFMAGRNVSATHVAFASTRVMATCAVMGQAAGTAAAQCLHEEVTPRQLASDPARVSRLKQTLLKDDCYLLGTANEDPLDLARRARVSASGEIECHSPRKVLSGITRQVGDESHQWAAPLLPLPLGEAGEFARAGGDQGRRGPGPGGEGSSRTGAWLRLDWPESEGPVTLSEVRLTFDTGFERPLTLTMSDHHTKNTIRAAQPETVRDYTLEALTPSGEWRSLAEVTGNYQRLRVHRFAPVQASALRLTVTATNGDEHARVFEVRAYA